MKRLITLTLLVLLLCVGVRGQTFDSGSTGADGPFNPPSQVPAGTQVSGDCLSAPGCSVVVPLREPPAHVYNFTTITIGQFVTVRFTPNRANTPVFLLAQGNVTIIGTINLDGQSGTLSSTAAAGGPGGFSGGMGALVTIEGPGSGGGGNGPGAGGSDPCAPYGGGGGFGSPGAGCGTSAGPAYGIPELQPLIGGSGGSGGNVVGGPPIRGGNGGGGGGAILIASTTLIDLSTGPGNAITANGGAGEPVPNQYTAGGGSGGAIRLVAGVIRGTRGLTAVGGGGTYGGGVGRIRLESVQAIQYTGPTNPAASVTKPGQQGPIFPAIMPTVRVVAIGGVPVPDPPTSDLTTPDVTLPNNFTNPVRIDLVANNVPSGSRARVFAAPQWGRGYRIITGPVLLLGSPGEPKTGLIEVNLPTRGVGLISAVIDSVIPEASGSANGDSKN